MLGLAYPEVYSDFVKSQLQMYKDGGLLPRGPVAGNYSMVMTGSPVTSFITGAWNKGIRDFDVNVAYDAMMDAHSVGGLFEKSAFEYDGWSGLGGIRDYLDRGYVPQELGGGPLNGGAGQTLEYAHQDFALAQLAQQLHKRGINVVAVREGDGVVGECRAGDRRAAGAFGRRALDADRRLAVAAAGLDDAAAGDADRAQRRRHAALQRRDVDGGQGGRQRRQPARGVGALRGRRARRDRGLGRPRRRGLPGGALAQLAQRLRSLVRLHPAQASRRLVASAVRSVGAGGLRRGQRLAGDAGSPRTT